jgi:hypothetical protein
MAYDDDWKQMEPLFGPYAGKILLMSAADATQAENDHWAMPMRAPPFDSNQAPAHGNLTPEERAAAELCAEIYAAGIQGQPIPGGDVGVTPHRERDMKPAPAAEYHTKDAPKRR